MSYFKKYGPGRVNVIPELTPGQSISLDANHDFLAQSCTMGAMYREALDNNAVHAHRGTNRPFEGAQSELAWSIGYIIPQSAATAAAGYQALLHAAGRDTTGNFASHSICNRTLQIARVDRDNLLVEVLNGALVSQADYAFSLSDVPLVTFSGVARSKLELHGDELTTPVEVTAGQEGVDIAGEHVVARYSYWMMGAPESEHPAPVAGIRVYFTTSAGTELAGFLTDVSEYSLRADFDEPLTATASITGYYFDLPDGASAESYPCTSADWSLTQVAIPDNIDLPVSSFNLTIETGLSYGNLTTGQRVPSAVLSGQSSITGSFSMYLDDLADDLMSVGDTSFILNLTGGSILLNHVRLTDKPSYELSATDAASGDFSFSVYSTTSFDGIAIH